MDYAEIRHRITQCRFTDHARREMEEDPLGVIYVGEVLQVLDTGEIIEEYTDDKPYPSCLVVGWTEAKRPLHIVCAPVPTEDRLIIITTYQPDPTRWQSDFKRRK